MALPPRDRRSISVLKGSLIIKLRDGNVRAGPGGRYAVRKGVENCKFAEDEVRLLLTEPAARPTLERNERCCEESNLSKRMAFRKRSLLALSAWQPTLSPQWERAQAPPVRPSAVPDLARPRSRANSRAGSAAFRSPLSAPANRASIKRSSARSRVSPDIVLCLCFLGVCQRKSRGCFEATVSSEHKRLEIVTQWSI